MRGTATTTTTKKEKVFRLVNTQEHKIEL